VLINIVAKRIENKISVIVIVAGAGGRAKVMGNKASSPDHGENTVAAISRDAPRTPM
jgi:uncharacterized protein YggU (UPF0235/DUF167 family)